MVFMIVFIEDFETKIYSLITMQILRVNYSYWIKSFNTKKDQIVEMFNEATYLVLMVLLTVYTSSDKWTEKTASIYMGIIFTYLLIFIAIALFTLIRFIWGAVKKLFIRLKIIRAKDIRSTESEVSNGFEGRSVQIFSDISFSIQHNQDSFRVENMYSFNSSGNQNFRRHSAYSL